MPLDLIKDLSRGASCSFAAPPLKINGLPSALKTESKNRATYAEKAAWRTVARPQNQKNRESRAESQAKN